VDIKARFQKGINTSISITVIEASTAQVSAQARSSEDQHNTSKSVSKSRTNFLVLLVFALMLMSSENLLL